jgi:hypothetical protein
LKLRRHRGESLVIVDRVSNHEPFEAAAREHSEQVLDVKNVVPALIKTDQKVVGAPEIVGGQDVRLQILEKRRVFRAPQNALISFGDRFSVVEHVDQI